MTTSLVLYGSPLSPFQRKVEAVMALKGLEYDCEDVSVMDMPDWYKAISPLGRIPSLRDRGQDALLIAAEMLSRFGEQYGRSSLEFSDDAEQAIVGYDWPGNVRELVNIIQRVAVLCEDDVVTASDLGLVGVEVSALGSHEPAHGDSASGAVFDFTTGRVSAESVERDLLVQALERTGGNISKAAELVGMRRTTFRYRLQRQNLEHLAKEIANR